MKAPLIAALLLSGCAAQPYQAPTVYSPPIDHETECLKAVIAINVFSDMATPMLKKCNAGDTGECVRFSLFFDKIKGNLQPDRVVECVDNRWLSVYHPQVVAFRAKTPAMNAQLERFTKRIGQ
jgi:hypothetical protein